MNPSHYLTKILHFPASWETAHVDAKERLISLMKERESQKS